MNWLVTLYNPRDDEYRYHTVFSDEGDLAAICKNLAGMLSDLTGRPWAYEDASFLSAHYPL